MIASGKEAYLVGGAVRDLLLKREIKDYDIATNASPDEITKIFPKSVAVGAKFGNVVAIVYDSSGESHDIDITTYRRDAEYFKGRWPSKVDFTQNIIEDLSRRDFTINSIALNLEIVFQEGKSIIEQSDFLDPHHGIDDMEKKVIRAVGIPIDRFSEDGLRAFRACRLASELDYSIEEDTKNAIRNSLEVAKQISMERIRDEFLKMIKYSKKPSVGIRLMDELGLLGIFLPELIHAKGITQPEWHNDDVFNHSLLALDLAEDDIKIAALFHDIGKTKTMSKDSTGVHFYGHDRVGAEMTLEILRRMRFSKSFAEEIAKLIELHMFFYPSADWRKDNIVEEIEPIAKEKRNEAFRHGWSDNAIRRFIRKAGGIDQIKKLFKLRIADAAANSKTTFNPKEIKALEERISEIIVEDMATKVTDLAINGNDLIQIGIKPGKEIGNILNELLEYVTDKPELNTKENLLNKVKEIRL